MRIEVTSDETKKKEIRAALKANDNYCPCRLEHIPENKCMCKEFMEQKSGPCHCGLYIKYEEWGIIYEYQIF